jgi:glycosyltransferase involved in cell wall biosynthesis
MTLEPTRARPRSDGRPIRVLAVDHTAGVGPFRKKFEALAAYPDVDLTVLAPARWIELHAVVEPPRSGRGYDIATGRVGFPGYANRGFYWTGLAGAIAGARPDILDLYEEPFSLFFLQCAILGRLLAPRARIVFHTSDSLSWDYRYPYRPSWLYAAIQRYAHRVSDLAFTINEVSGEILRSKGYDRPIRQLFHGIDPEEFKPSCAAVLRRELGLEGPVVGYVGRLTRWKGVHVLIDAVATLDPPPALLILGSGEERDALETRAGERGIAATTRFVSGVPHGDVPPYLNAIDIMVLPSIRSQWSNESFGRVLVEAMACAVPVVGTTCGSMDLVLGDAGVIVPEGDPGALASELGRLLANEPARRALADRGRRRALERYTWTRFAEIVRDTYFELVGRGES